MAIGQKKLTNWLEDRTSTKWGDVANLGSIDFHGIGQPLPWHNECHLVVYRNHRHRCMFFRISVDWGSGAIYIQPFDLAVASQQKSKAISVRVAGNSLGLFSPIPVAGLIGGGNLTRQLFHGKKAFLSLHRTKSDCINHILDRGHRPDRGENHKKFSP